MYGFSVFQPTIGAALQWLPPLGTPELDEMVHAIIPGPSSIADKRAHIAMDFFEYSQQTGKNFKFYSAPASFASTTAASPASSAALYDSGYGTSFNASPVVSDMSPWTPSTAYTPSVSAEEIKTKPRSASRKSTASSSKQADFSNHPGMRIMTKDGRDVTNSASRGCKTKEQRDHAHLMRIIKACDSCKRKKIRCDPSHKKRAASASSPQEVKPAKKAKKASPPASPPPAPAWDMHNFPAPSTSNSPEGQSSSSSFETSPEDEVWSQFVLFDTEPTTLADSFNPDDYDFSDCFDFSMPDFLTPGSSTSSSSPDQWMAPFTPAQPGPSPPVVISEAFPDTSPQDLNLPYLNPGSHSSDYVDFNLYSSPPADFFLDEEPVEAKKALASGASREQSPQHNVDTQTALRQQSTESIVVAHSDGYYSSPSSFQTDAFHNDGQQSGVRRLDEYRYAATVMAPSSDRQHSPIQDHAILQGRDSRGVLQSIPQHGDSPSTSQSSSPTQQHSSGDAEPRALGAAVSSRPSHASIHSESRTSASPGIAQYSGGDRPAEWHVPGGTPPPPGSPATSVTRGLATHGRSLSTGQQLQTVSIHSTASTRPSLTRPHQSAVPGLAERSHLSVSPSVTIPGEHWRSMSASPPTAPCYLESSPGGRAAIDTPLGSTGPALTAVLATVLLTTSPMRRLVGEYAKNGQPLSSQTLFQLAVFGLISSLLVFAVQNNFLGTQADIRVCLNVLVITSLSFASTHQGCSRLPAATALSVPTLTSTIDNVKTKIHGVGQMVDGLRCAVSQRLRSFLPLSRSLSLMRF